jgi:hypothetical protein
MSTTTENVTRAGHVAQVLAEAEATIAEARVLTAKPMRRKAEREALMRRLSGVVGGCESVRLWLDKGAPQ